MSKSPDRQTIKSDFLIRQLAREAAHANCWTCRGDQRGGPNSRHSATCDNATIVIENNMMALVAMIGDTPKDGDA